MRVSALRPRLRGREPSPHAVRAAKVSDHPGTFSCFGNLGDAEAAHGALRFRERRAAPTKLPCTSRPPTVTAPGKAAMSTRPDEMGMSQRGSTTVTLMPFRTGRSPRPDGVGRACSGSYDQYFGG